MAEKKDESQERNRGWGLSKYLIRGGGADWSWAPNLGSWAEEVTLVTCRRCIGVETQRRAWTVPELALVVCLFDRGQRRYSSMTGNVEHWDCFLVFTVDLRCLVKSTVVTRATLWLV